MEQQTIASYSSRGFMLLYDLKEDSPGYVPRKPTIMLAYPDSILEEIVRKLGVNAKLQTQNLGMEDVTVNIVKDCPSPGMTGLVVLLDARRIPKDPVTLIGRCHFEEIDTCFLRKLCHGFSVAITDLPRRGREDDVREYVSRIIIPGGNVYFAKPAFDKYLKYVSENLPRPSRFPVLNHPCPG